jgi:hypothetical protein
MHATRHLRDKRDVETRVSLSVHYRILPLPKHHPALILRTSLVPLRTFIFIFIDSVCARLALLPISCSSHVHWCSLVRFSCYSLLSNISELILTPSRCARYRKPLLHVCILIFSLLGLQLRTCASSDACSFTYILDFM